MGDVVCNIVVNAEFLASASGLPGQLVAPPERGGVEPALRPSAPPALYGGSCPGMGPGMCVTPTDGC